MVKTNDRPFLATANAIDARYYGKDIGQIQFCGNNKFA